MFKKLFLCDSSKFLAYRLLYILTFNFNHFIQIKIILRYSKVLSNLITINFYLKFITK